MSCKSHVSCVVFAIQATSFWYTQNEILYMVFDSSCYHHNGKCLMVAICSSMLSDWLFLLAWSINFTSLRLISVHTVLYIKKDCCAYKVYDILAKHYLVKKYVEVNFRGEMLWMFWQRDAWTNFSVTPYQYLVLGSTNCQRLNFCFPPNAMWYLLDYNSHACKSSSSSCLSL